MSATRSEPLHLRPVIDELPRLVAYIAAFGLPSADSTAITLAAEELFANTISHSRPRANSVEFSLAADDLSASAVYAEEGPAFDPTTLPEVDTTLPQEQRRIGGLGIHIIRRTMSTFRYERRDGRNIITFGRPLNHVETIALNSDRISLP